MNDWDDIRFFLAVARSGSISSAAKQLGVNHSTVSRRIQAFENKHGVQLFNRQPGGYQMLPSADAIYTTALSIEAQNLEISRTLFGQDTRLEGPINITMPHDIFEYCLAEELQQFAQQHPGIELNLMVSKGVRNLASREADIAIRLTPEPPEYLVGRKIAPIQHGIYSATDTAPGNTADLVLWQGDDAQPSWAAKYFPDSRVALRVDDLSSMYAAVKAGFGVARMPCYMPDGLHELHKLPLVLPQSSWSLWLLSHVDLRKTARVQTCRAFLLQALQSKADLFSGAASDQ